MSNTMLHEVGIHRALLLVDNYWEIQPTRMSAHFDDLIESGIHHVVSFVPWQAFESDIAHTLMKFLTAAADKNVSVSLIVTPEVGVHYQRAGLPKDVLNCPDSKAMDRFERPIQVNLPPGSFSLPSLFAEKFQRRYTNFLSRFQGFLADFNRSQPAAMEGVEVIITGSYWKYYRSAVDASHRCFGSLCGDRSKSASLNYRKRVEEFYSRPEFCDPDPLRANRWKTRTFDEVNRRWFHQQAEEVFRFRTAQTLKSRAVPTPIRQVELFTPEADPSYHYTQFLQTVSGFHGDFSQLSRILEEASTRESALNDEACAPWVHWTFLGGFSSLSDSEKQFLLLKSLLLMGSRGGGVLIDAKEWLGLSTSFRNRTEAICRSLEHRKLYLSTQAVFLTSHLWSSGGILWEVLRRELGAHSRMVASVDHLIRSPEVRVALIDPSLLLTRDTIVDLVRWVRRGRILALPQTPLMTDEARVAFTQLVGEAEKIDFDLGVNYKHYAVGEGRLIEFELPEGEQFSGEMIQSWSTMIRGLLGLGEVERESRLSDSRLSSIALNRRAEGGLGLFVLNETGRTVSADILFREAVGVSDLTFRIDPDSSAPVRHSRDSSQDHGEVSTANRFSLEVPACGILPIGVDGLGRESEESREAAQLSELTQQSAMEAAHSELPGLESLESMAGPGGMEMDGMGLGSPFSQDKEIEWH